MKEQKRKELIEDLADSLKAEALEETIRREIDKIRKEVLENAKGMEEVEGGRLAIKRLKNVIRKLHPNPTSEDSDKEYPYR